MTTHTHADLIAETRELLNERWLVRFGSEHKDVKNLLTRLAGALHSSEGKATEGEAPFEIGCTVKLKDADLVGTLLEFNEPITGALIRWSHNGDEIWKALRNLEVVSQPSEGEGPGADICAVHCSICEGMDHHWDYFGDEIDGEPVYSCKHCEAIKPVEDADDALASPSPPVSREADELGKWLSAAMDDPNVCDAMKADINAWFNAGQPVPNAAVLVSREAVARVIDPAEWYGEHPNEWGRAPSLAKADAILRLLQPLAGGTRHDGQERCIACLRPFADGERYLGDASGGFIHAGCCGPERESYTNADGEPLGPDDPIPAGAIWSAPPSPIEAEEVEAVARALCLHNACQPDDDDEFEGSAMWTNWEDEALAAIQASRGYWEKKR